MLKTPVRPQVQQAIEDQQARTDALNCTVRLPMPGLFQHRQISRLHAQSMYQ